MTAYVESAAAALGGIDILVNNASGFGAGDSEAGWATRIDVDLLGSVRATRAARPWLENSAAASVIHIASIAGQAASARTAAYGAVKAALLQYTQSQAADMAAHGVRVNAVAPGSTDFPAVSGSSARPAIRRSTTARWPVFPLAALAGRTRSPTPWSFSPRRWRRGSPARP